MFQRVFAFGAHRHIAGDDRNLGLKVDAMLFIGQRHIVAGTQKTVRATLIDQRFAGRARGPIHSGCLLHALQMRLVGRCVEPLISARQRCHALCRVECKWAFGLSLIQVCVERIELRREKIPVVERALERGRNCIGQMRSFQVTRDDGKLPIARTLSKGGEFHGPSCWSFIEMARQVICGGASVHAPCPQFTPLRSSANTN